MEEAKAAEFFRPLDQETRYLQHLRDVVVGTQVDTGVDEQLARAGLFPETKFDGTYPVRSTVAGYKNPPPPGGGP